MSFRSFAFGTAFGVTLALVAGLYTQVDAANPNPQRMRAANELIGATVRLREFESMLEQVIEGFTEQIKAQARGRSNRLVGQVLMEQASAAISENRKKYLEGIARIYATHMRASYLRKAKEFFASRAGRRWVEVQDKILEDTIQYAVAQAEVLRDRIVNESIDELQNHGYTTRD